MSEWRGRMVRGIVRAFSSGTYLASVELVGSRELVLTGVQVNRGLSSGAVTVGAGCVVALLSEHDPKDAVVLAVM